MGATTPTRPSPAGGQACGTEGRAPHDETCDPARELRELALTCSFLSRALSDDEVGAGFLAALAAERPQTGTELDAFAARLTGLGADGLERQRRELAADHAACLLGMSADPVSPYESVHTSGKRLMMQEARDQVVRSYAQAGFVKPAGLHLPEDHVAIELEFAGALAARAAEALEHGRQDDADRAQGQLDAFWRDHLAAWVPGFCDKLEVRAQTAFYRGVAQMLRELLATAA